MSAVAGGCWHRHERHARLSSLQPTAWTSVALVTVLVTQMGALALVRVYPKHVLGTRLPRPVYFAQLDTSHQGVPSHHHLPLGARPEARPEGDLPVVFAPRVV